MFKKYLFFAAKNDLILKQKQVIFVKENLEKLNIHFIKFIITENTRVYYTWLTSLHVGHKSTYNRNYYIEANN